MTVLEMDSTKWHQYFDCYIRVIPLHRHRQGDDMLKACPVTC